MSTATARSDRMRHEPLPLADQFPDDYVDWLTSLDQQGYDRLPVDPSVPLGTRSSTSAKPYPTLRIPPSCINDDATQL